MNIRQEVLTEIQDLKRLLQVGNDQHCLKNKDVKKIFDCSDSKLELLRKPESCRLQNCKEPLKF